jgi:hypothetical protein
VAFTRASGASKGALVLFSDTFFQPCRLNELLSPCLSQTVQCCSSLLRLDNTKRSISIVPSQLRSEGRSQATIDRKIWNAMKVCAQLISLDAQSSGQIVFANTFFGFPLRATRPP